MSVIVIIHLLLLLLAFQKMSKSVQQKPRSKPHDIMNSNSKMKMKPKAPKKKGVKEADKKVRQSISNGELIKVKSS